MFVLRIKNKFYRVSFAFPHKGRHIKNQKLTICYLYNGKNLEDIRNLVIKGHAVCVPPDVFNKELGRKHAFTNAIRGFSKEERTAFWKAFWEWCGKRREQSESVAMSA